MCEAAIAFGDYTLPAAATTPEVEETVIEDSQPPMDDFDLHTNVASREDPATNNKR